LRQQGDTAPLRPSLLQRALQVQRCLCPAVPSQRSGGGGSSSPNPIEPRGWKRDPPALRWKKAHVRDHGGAPPAIRHRHRQDVLGLRPSEDLVRHR
jgi:hypothetical protein